MNILKYVLIVQILWIAVCPTARAETAALSLASPSTGEQLEKILVVAHRGASKQAPENTLPAFELAWRQGADAIEGDFRLTKDGQIVCIHDDTTKRTTGRNLVVAHSTVSELRELDAGAWRGAEFKETRIPTMAEVFSTIPDTKKIYIEIKSGPEIIPLLLKELRASNLQREQVVLISFNENVIEGLKAKVPEYTANWLCSFKRQESGEMTPSLTKVLETLERVQADGFSSNIHIPEPTIKAIQERGYAWHVWTVNDPKQARKASKMGAQSITTDVPGSLRAKLFETR